MTTAHGLVTTTTAMERLGRNREQVLKLVDAGLLPETGRFGRARLLDPAALAALAARPRLPDVGNPADTTPGSALPYALALHLGPRTRDRNPHNGRTFAGWNAVMVNADDAWTGWWNTGAQTATRCVRAALPALPSVSGFVVDVRVIAGWVPHPVYPGLVQFQVTPAPETVRARFDGAVFRPASGPPWQRLWQGRDTAREISVAGDRTQLGRGASGKAS